MSILSFEEPYTDNEVVGYYEDKLIVKREAGELFFCEIPENLIEIGETISPKDLTSISELPYNVQKKLRINMQIERCKKWLTIRQNQNRQKKK